MAYSNGQPKAANGLTYGNGSVNGKMNGNGAANGKSLARRGHKKQRGFFASLFSIVARLTTWAAILTVLFRCPASLDACDDSSPYICRPYFQAKNAVIPHAKPYYDQYAAPYVEVARPYYNAVDSTVLSPTRKYAVQYGGPWAHKAQNYALEQWKVTGEPKLTQLRDASHAQYQLSVEPLLQQATSAVGPYYEIARTNGLQAYYEYLVPGYNFAQPYLKQGYESAADFTANSAVPAAHWTWNKTYAFLDTAVWPQIRELYLEHVDPQLVRIGERLGRYKTTAKQSAASVPIPEPSAIKEAIASSFNKPSSYQSTETSSGSSTTQTDEPAETIEIEQFTEDAYDNPVQAPPAAPNESEKRRKAREMVANDLELWQNKYAAAADQGAADMEERVGEIAQQKITEDVQVTGKALATDLKSAIEAQLAILKGRISEIVSDENIAGSDAEEEVTLAVRAAGVAIKDKAQKLRAWRETFDQDLQKTVVHAADGHFRILDETRALALQEIGMRWAWADGVTYKDWAKYHELKATLNNWTEQLKELIVSNPALLEAQDAAAQVEDEAMDVAGSAAKELVRLKEVAHYKIVAEDSSDNFEVEAMKLAAEAAIAAKEAARAAEQSAREAASQAAESAAASAQEASASASTVAEDAANTIVEKASGASEALDERSTAASQSVASILSEGEDATSEIGQELSSSATSASSEVEGVASQASNLASEATESVKSVVDEVSEAAEEFTRAASASVHAIVDGAESQASEVSSDVSSEASSLWDDAESVATDAASEDSEASDVFQDEKSQAEAAATAMVSDASEAIVGQTQSIVSNVTEGSTEDQDDDEPLEIIEDPVAAREETDTSPEEPEHVKPAFIPGAAAQEVPNRQPILEDYVDTDLLESATNAAANAYSTALAKASEQYSSAVSVVSAQIYGTPKPVHEQLLASVSAAYDFAVAAASTKYEQAVGTPTPTQQPAMVDWSKVEEIASQRLNEGRLWAELQYQSAVIALGLATPTPSSASEKYLEQAKRNYFAGLGLAQDRYSSFLDAASSVMSSMTATPTPTDFMGRATAAAAAARESAESIAHLAEEAVESAYSAAGEKVASVASAVDDSIAGVVDGVTEQAYLAGAAIAETWDNALAQISGQVYGEQKNLGWYDGWFDEASSYVSKATDAVAEGASAASDKAEDSAVTASAEAAKQYDAVSQLVSELINGKEPTFSESVLSRLSAAYATAAAGVGSYASEASAAAASVGEKIGSAASEATEAVKESVQQARDEL